ncbi:hypothetical protein FHT82_002269 [Rhizobium sp. BK275]|nr:hypothetical protein [Rhizobium sp. BK275]
MDVGRFHQPQMRLVCGSAGAEWVQQHESGSGGETAEQGTALIVGTSKMEDTATLLLTSCITRFAELRMIGEGVHRENDRRATTMLQRRHRFEKP